jgi:hypothetical protein
MANKGGSQFKATLGKYIVRPYLKKHFTKIGLVEWLKVKALSSNPSTPHTHIQNIYIDNIICHQRNANKVTVREPPIRMTEIKSANTPCW